MCKRFGLGWLVGGKWNLYYFVQHKIHIKCSVGTDESKVAACLFGRKSIQVRGEKEENTETSRMHLITVNSDDDDSDMTMTYQ